MDFEQFITKFIEKIQSETIVHGTISQPRQRSSELKRIRYRPVEISGDLHLHFEYQYGKKMTHKNVPLKEIEAALTPLLQEFRQVHAQFEESFLHVQISKRFKVMWKEKKSAEKKQATLVHNRKKQYLLAENKVHPFLVRLGVQTEDGKIKKQYYDKFKQINRFVEFIDDALKYLPQNRQIKILDFGSGKSYLTFALYHYLHIEKGLNIRVTGLDLKKDVINMCDQIAKDLKYDNLDFKVGDIGDYADEEKVDMVVTLHACDVATDLALAKAVKWGAQVILSVPCCQHELRNQLDAPELDIMLKHGFIKEQFSAIATDSLRAELLNLVGYETQLLEFISMEHTPKNTLIRAYYTGKKPNEEQITSYKKFRDMLSAEPFLENEIGKFVPGLVD